MSDACSFPVLLFSLFQGVYGNANASFIHVLENSCYHVALRIIDSQESHSANDTTTDTDTETNDDVNIDNITTLSLDLDMDDTVSEQSVQEEDNKLNNSNNNSHNNESHNNNGGSCSNSKSNSTVRHGCSLLHVEMATEDQSSYSNPSANTNESTSNYSNKHYDRSQQCSGLARKLVGAALVPKVSNNSNSIPSNSSHSEEVAVVLEALALPYIGSADVFTRQSRCESRSVYDNIGDGDDDAMVDAMLEVAQYEPPAGIVYDNTNMYNNISSANDGNGVESRMRSSSDGTTAMNDNDNNTNRTRTHSTGPSNVSSSRSPRDSVSDILSSLPSLLDSPRASISGPKQYFDSIKYSSNNNSNDSGNGVNGSAAGDLATGTNNTNSKSYIDQMRDRVSSQSSPLSSPLSALLRSATMAINDSTNAQVREINVDDINNNNTEDDNEVSMEYTAAAIAASIHKSNNKHHYTTDSHAFATNSASNTSVQPCSVPSYLPHYGVHTHNNSNTNTNNSVAVLRRKWRRRIRLLLSPLRVTSEVFSCGGTSGSSGGSGAALLNVLLKPTLEGSGVNGPGSVLRIESMKLVARENKNKNKYQNKKNSNTNIENKYQDETDTVEKMSTKHFHKSVDNLANSDVTSEGDATNTDIHVNRSNSVSPVPPPHVALVYIGGQKLPADVQSGSVLSIILHPVVVRSTSGAAAAAAARMELLSVSSNNNSRNHSQKSVKSAADFPNAVTSMSSSQDNYVFDLIIAVRCGEGGDRILLRHETSWTLPPAQKLLLSIEKIKQTQVTNTSNHINGLQEDSGPCNFSLRQVELRIQITNTTSTVMDLVLLTAQHNNTHQSINRYEQGSEKKKQLNPLQENDYDSGEPRTHTWINSEMPIGAIAPNASRSIQCSIVPLV